LKENHAAYRQFPVGNERKKRLQDQKFDTVAVQKITLCIMGIQRAHNLFLYRALNDIQSLLQQFCVTLYSLTNQYVATGIKEG
jgi:hypothetical protein